MRLIPEEPVLDDRGGEVPRPSIPLLAYPTVALCTGSSIVHEALWQHMTGHLLSGIFILVLPALAVVTVLVTSVRLARRKQGISPIDSPAVRILLIVVISFFAGTLTGNAQARQWERSLETFGSTYQSSKTILITGDMVTGTYACRSEGKLEVGDNRWIPISITWNDEEQVLPAGTTFKGYGTNREVELEDPYAKNDYDRGTCGTIHVRQIEDIWQRPGFLGAIAGFRNRIALKLESLDQEGMALLAGVVLGNRSFLSDSQVQGDFRTCGLSHLIAVSGSHLVVVSGLIGVLFRGRKVPAAARIGITLVLLFIYVALTGYQTSAIRSLLMTLCSQIALFGHRRSHGLSAACFVCTCLVLANPTVLYRVSLQLSLAAVIGIALFCRYIASWIVTVFPSVPRNLSDSVALTLSAQSTTTGIQTATFSILSLISPLANLVVTPLVSFMLLLGIIICPLSVLTGDLLDPLLTFLCLFATFIGKVAAILASIPNSCISLKVATFPAFLINGAVIGALWLFWPKPSRRIAKPVVVALICFVLASTAIRFFPKGDRIVMLDVGQGDAMLVSSDGVNLLIDTGPPDGNVAARLHEEGVTTLDGVIITHLHDDHYGALDTLDTFHVPYVFFAEDALDERYAGQEALVDARNLVGEDHVMGIVPGDVLSFGGFSLQLLAPDHFIEQGGNQDSLCFLVTYDLEPDGIPDCSMFTTGDAETEVLERIEDNQGLPDVDILKVGHHGSKVSFTEEQLALLSPRLALIGVGAGNEYGHPADNTILMLEDAGVTVGRTDRDGDIRVSMEDFCADLANDVG